MKTAYLIAGLGYGDEGKGATVDFLCRTRDIHAVVRYNGGSQAGHNVVTPDGKHHTFSQFGSGSFVPGVRTHLSEHVLIDPLNMLNEALHLRELGIEAFDSLTVHPRCLVITPFQKLVNRIHLAISGKKNSCGAGVGQTRFDEIHKSNLVLRVGDLHDRQKTREKLEFHQRLATAVISHFFSGPDLISQFCPELYDELIDPVAPDLYASAYWKIPIKTAPLVIGEHENVVFEGAQGALLDETHGDPGYNTWTDTTFYNALDLLEEVRWNGRIQKIGVLRTYATRHGEGPFATEDPQYDELQEPQNTDGGYQGKFRRGRFNLKLVRRALKIVGGVDGIALNHCDFLPHWWPQSFLPPIPEEIENQAFIYGYGPTANERNFARHPSRAVSV